MSALPYLTITRPQNVAMTGIAVALGFWLSRPGFSGRSFVVLLLLVAAAGCAAAYGNVANDLKDVETDRVSHPARPLPRGEISMVAAWTFLLLLALLSAVFAWLVSPLHAVATAIPLALLAAYALFLKGTPLVGNIVVSMLVSYALLFGGIGAPGFDRLLLPALLAFLLNFMREIIKDIQDEPGDRSAGIRTTAAIPGPVIRTILYCVTAFYCGLLYLPALLRQYGRVYAIACTAVVLPLCIAWTVSFAGKNWRTRLSLLSTMLKIEMAAGLAALAADQLWGK